MRVSNAEPIKTSTSEKIAFWKMHIDSLNTGNLSRNDYCSANKLNYHRFGYWLRKLSDESLPLIPVKITDTSESPIALCTIKLKNGSVLSIHSMDALSVLLEKMA